MSGTTRREPIRVLILIAQLGRGGAERQVFELVTRLDRKEILPMVVTYEPDTEYRAMLEAAGIEVIALDKSGLKEPLTLMRLARIIRSRRIDLVHSWLFPANWRAIVASRLAGTRAVICATRSTSTAMSRRLRIMNGFALRNARVVLANASAVADDISENSGISRGSIRVILNGVDTSVFSPGGSPLRAGWLSGAGDGARLVGFVGGFRKAKDPCLFVRVAAEVARRSPSTRFVMVGDGVLRREVESAVREHGMEDRLVLAGQRPDMPEVFRALDTLVITSYREGCCNAILEAMATGVPVVATAVGGNPDIVTHRETGWLFPYGDAAAGAEGILALISDPELRARLAANGLERALRDFSIGAMVSATTRMYRESA